MKPLARRPGLISARNTILIGKRPVSPALPKRRGISEAPA